MALFIILTSINGSGRVAALAGAEAVVHPMRRVRLSVVDYQTFIPLGL